MSTPSPLPADIGKITEPLLLGHFLQWTLFGVLSMQVYIYYLVFPNDPRLKKLLVYAVYTVELVQAILVARVAYTEFAAGFGNLEAVNTIGLLSIAAPILSSIVAGVVQTFYAYRIKVLADSYLIPSVVILIAVIQLGGGITVGALSAQISVFSNLREKKTLIAWAIGNGSSAVCDVIIAASMTYYLSRRKGALKSTQRMIRGLTRMVIETGTLTAIIAVMNLVFFQIPGITYYQTTYEVLGKMYSNTMMMNINSRMVSGFGTNETLSNELSPLGRLVFTTPRGGFTSPSSTVEPLPNNKSRDPPCQCQCQC